MNDTPDLTDEELEEQVFELLNDGDIEIDYDHEGHMMLKISRSDVQGAELRRVYKRTIH